MSIAEMNFSASAQSMTAANFSRQDIMESRWHHDDE